MQKSIPYTINIDQCKHISAKKKYYNSKDNKYYCRICLSKKAKKKQVQLDLFCMDEGKLVYRTTDEIDLHKCTTCKHKNLKLKECRKKYTPTPGEEYGIFIQCDGYKYYDWDKHYKDMRFF